MECPIPQPASVVSDSTQRRRVMLLSYRFPTANSALIASRRAEALYRYLSEFGWDPTVITAAAAGLPAEVVQVRDRSWAARVERGGRNDPSRLPRELRGGVVATARRAVKEALRYLPPYYDRYGRFSLDAVAPAVTTGRGADLVWATCSPLSLAHAVRIVARKLGVPYVLDFRDPPEEGLGGGPDFWLSRAVCDAAAITVAAPSCITPLLEQRDPLLILSGAWRATPLQPCPSQRFTILHAGTWHSSYDAAPLLRAVRWLADAAPDFRRDCRLLFVGRGSAYVPESPDYGPVADMVETRPLAPEVEGLLAEAGVLLIARAAVGYKAQAITGKVFEYLSCAAPVLSIGGQPGLHGELIAWLGGSLWTNDAQTIAGFLRREFERWRASGTTRVQRSPEALEYLSQRRAAAETAEVFNAAVEQRAVRTRPDAPWRREALP